VQDRYSPANSYTKIEFPVEDLKSFHPASLVREVESLRKTFEGRQALADLRDRKINREQFLEKLKASPLPMLSPEAFSKALSSAADSGTKPASMPPRIPIPALAAHDEGALDSILDMVEAPGNLRQAPAETTEGAARVQQFISEMFAGTGAQSPADRRALDGLIEECDRALSEQVNDVLCDREFQRLEASWRSLKFLVDRTDFREPIQLEVIPAGKKQFIEALKTLLENSEIAEVPPAAVIADFELENSPPDMELLKEAAELAEQLQAALLVNVGAAFFGKSDAWEVVRIPLLQTQFESPEYIKWNAFRQSEASRWVGVCFNRFLLRGSDDGSLAGKLPFRFKERDDGLWGNPAWAIGSLLARSFAQSGWCGHITGIRGGGVLEDLPVYSCRLASGAETQIPLETIFLKGGEDDFFAVGFMVLQSGDNQDKAVLLRAPSAHRPEIYSDARATEASRWRSMLTHQIVAARFVHHLSPMLQRLLPLGSPTEIERGVEQGLRALTARSGAAATAGVQASLGASEVRPGFRELVIEIQPGPSIWSLPIALELRMNLRT
jgi:type VI secretion system protein ImpC